MRWFARCRDGLNYKMHFSGQPFGIASFPSQRLARCGGLKEETFINTYIYKLIIESCSDSPEAYYTSGGPTSSELSSSHSMLVSTSSLRSSSIPGPESFKNYELSSAPSSSTPTASAPPASVRIMPNSSSSPFLLARKGFFA
jgi:hypothetical protein